MQFGLVYIYYITITLLYVNQYKMIFNYFYKLKNIFQIFINKINIQPIVFNIATIILLYIIFIQNQFNFLYNTNKIHIILYFVFITPMILGLFSRFLGRNGVIFYIVSGYTFILSYLATIIYINLTNNNLINYVYFGEWLNTGTFDVKWEFILDNISLTMLIIVLLITFCVLLYSIGY